MKNKNLSYGTATYLIVCIILYFLQDKLPRIKDLTFLPDNTPFLAGAILFIPIIPIYFFCKIMAIILSKKK